MGKAGMKQPFFICLFGYQDECVGLDVFRVVSFGIQKQYMGLPLLYYPTWLIRTRRQSMLWVPSIKDYHLVGPQKSALVVSLSL